MELELKPLELELGLGVDHGIGIGIETPRIGIGIAIPELDPTLILGKLGVSSSGLTTSCGSYLTAI